MIHLNDYKRLPTVIEQVFFNLVQIRVPSFRRHVEGKGRHYRQQRFTAAVDPKLIQVSRQFTNLLRNLVELRRAPDGRFDVELR